MRGRYVRFETLNALPPEKLEEYCMDERYCSTSETGGEYQLFVGVDNPENVTDEFRQYLENLYLRITTTRTAAASKPTPKTKVTIRTSPYHDNDYCPPWDSDLLDAISPDKFHTQGQSPLFKLSAEVRSLIFTFVLTEYEDLGRRYASDEQNLGTFFCYSRPGWYAPWIIDWAILRTCRRIYYEAGHLPMRLATHRWCRYLPKPRGKGEGYNFSSLGNLPIQRLTRHNLSNVTKIAILAAPDFLQSMHIQFEDMEYIRGHDPYPNLEYLTVTIPWSGWFPQDPGELEYDLVGCQYWPEIKKRLRLELEVISSNREDVKRLKCLTNELRNGRLNFETVNGTPLVPAPEWPSVQWPFEFSNHVIQSDFAYVRHISERKTDFMMTTCDYVPGRPPAVWADIRDTLEYNGMETFTSLH